MNTKNERLFIAKFVVEREISVDLSIQRYYEEKEEPEMCLECRSTL